MITKSASDAETTLLGGLLTVAQAAEHLFITDQTLAKWRRIGYGPSFVEVGPRRFHYRRHDIDAWLAGQVKAPTPSDAKTVPNQTGLLRKKTIPA